MLVVWKLKRELQQLEQQGPLDGEIILVPVANPIGQNQNLMNIYSGCNETGLNNHSHDGYYEILDDTGRNSRNRIWNFVFHNPS